MSLTKAGNHSSPSQIYRSSYLAAGYVALALFCIFSLPTLVPVKLANSDSYVFGYNNRAGFLLIVLFTTIASTLARRRNLQPISASNSATSARSSLFWKCTFVTIVIGAAMYILTHRMASYGESTYLINRIELSSRGLHPYRDFEFAYGVGLLYAPILLSHLLHLSIPNAYYFFWIISLVLGTWFLFEIVNRIDYPGRHRNQIFLVLFAVTLLEAVYVGTNYTSLRFAIAPFAAILVCQTMREGGLIAQVRSSLLALLFASLLLLISPEIAIAYILGISAFMLLFYAREPRIHWIVRLCRPPPLVRISAGSSQSLPGVRYSEVDRRRRFELPHHPFAQHPLLPLRSLPLRPARPILDPARQLSREPHLRPVRLLPHARLRFRPMRPWPPLLERPSHFPHRFLVGLGLKADLVLVSIRVHRHLHRNQSSVNAYLLSGRTRPRSHQPVPVSWQPEELGGDNSSPECANNPDNMAKLAEYSLLATHDASRDDLQLPFRLEPPVEAPFGYTASHNPDRLDLGYYWGIQDALTEKTVTRKITELEKHSDRQLILPEHFQTNCSVDPATSTKIIRILFAFPYRSRPRHTQSVYQPLCAYISSHYALTTPSRPETYGFQLWSPK